jgi:hypothetical protein
MLSAMLALAWAMPTAMVAPHVAYAQAASCVLSGGRIIIIGGKAICFPPASNACPVTVGTLTLAPVVTRSSGVSPLLVFFDATASTDTAVAANLSAFQDVNFAWTFGDGSAVSGSGARWLYGSNPSGNSRNTATGGIAAHLYIVPDGAGDQTYNIQAVAFDGVNTASCNMSVTAFDASGANGFPGTATICAFNTSLGSGCPSGATQLTTSSASTATASLTGGKRVLLKCGDSFTGQTTLITNTKNSLGAYGACAGVAITSATQANYPNLSDTVNVDTLSTDVRISDLVVSPGADNAVAVRNNFIPPFSPTLQTTMWNLWSNATNESYYVAQGSQTGYIQLVQTGMGLNQGTFVNFAENNCLNGSSAANCGLGRSTTPADYVNISYTAMMGGSYNGVGAPDMCGGVLCGGIETVRVSACRMCVLSNNLIENANTVGAVLKFHDGNTKDSLTTFIGQFAEFIELSDNAFTGKSGAQLVENTPQNAQDDERLRNIVFERNLLDGSNTTLGREWLLGGVNITARDNVFNGVVSGGNGIQIAQRGIEPVPQFVEIYNNTCMGGGSCANFSGTNFAAPGINSFASNNLISQGSAIGNSGTGNTITNNSTSPSSNSGFTNVSGTFGFISDFKPTANFTIPCTPFPSCTAVPVFFDALGVPWSPTWDLGAVHH